VSGFDVKFRELENRVHPVLEGFIEGGLTVGRDEQDTFVVLNKIEKHYNMKC
jgi:hypothetical protein